jgi:hypothetical protein
LIVASGCLGLSACGGDDDSGSAETTRTPETAAAPPKARPVVDTAQVESRLEKILRGVELSALPATIYPKGGGPPEQSQVGGGKLKVRAVTCPSNVPQEVGGTFTCNVDAGRTSASVELKQLNETGTRLRYTTSIESEDATGIPVTTELKGRMKLR